MYLYHQKETIAQHPAGPSVVLLKGKSFQMPIQRSRVRVPILLHSQMLEVAYFVKFWPFRNKRLITISLSPSGTKRPNPCVLDSLWITEFGFLSQMARNALSVLIEGRRKIGTEKRNVCVPLSLQSCRVDATGLPLCLPAQILPSRQGGLLLPKAPWELQEAGTTLQPFLFAIMYKKNEKIIVSSKSGLTGVSLLLH